MIKKIIFFLVALILLTGFISGAGTTTKIRIDILTGIGKLIGENINNDDITAKGVNVIREDEKSTIQFIDEGASANIKGVLFENIDTDKLAYIEFENGEMTKADLTASENTVFNFKGKGAYELSKGNRIILDEGKITIKKEEGGDLITIFDEPEEEAGLFQIKMSGESVNIEKTTEGTILTGDYDIYGNKISGISENNLGKATISKNGEILKLWKGTEATIRNINHKVAGDSLNVYYEDGFDLSKHASENYVNYGEDSLKFGGTGYTTKFEKDNKIFGFMENKVGDKTRNLEITMNGGNLELSKDNSKQDDLAFNVKGSGDFVINNGRTIIESQKILKIVNGESVDTGESNLLAKADFDYANGLSSSYDINFNDGDYKLEDNLLKHKSGKVLFNLKTPWENAVYQATNFPITKEEVAKIEKTTGEGTHRNWGFAFRDESLDKIIFEGTKSANKNTKGVKISAEEFAATVAREGWFYKATETTDSVWDIYQKDPEYEFPANQMSIGLAGIDGYFKDLKEGGFISSDISLTHGFFGTQIKAKDLAEITAGTYAYFKSKAQKAAGEKWNTYTKNQQHALAVYAFNTGSPAGGNTLKYILNPITVEEGYKIGSAEKNAKIGEAIYLDLKEYFRII